MMRGKEGRGRGSACPVESRRVCFAVSRCMVGEGSCTLTWEEEVIVEVIWGRESALVKLK
jgi:hypothetical protein